MKKVIHTLLAIFGLIFAFACGESSSGVERNKFIDELTGAELEAFCEWNESERGGARAVNCGNGIGVQVEASADCIASTMRPHCTVGLAEDCVFSLDGDQCKLLSSAECSTYLQCVAGG